MKKYGGVIENWHKFDAGYYGARAVLEAKYGKNLGYVMCGNLGVDPTDRGFGHGPIRTSLVVAETHDANGTLSQIETLNTIYHLGQERT